MFTAPWLAWRPLPPRNMLISPSCGRRLRDQGPTHSLPPVMKLGSFWMMWVYIEHKHLKTKKIQVFFRRLHFVSVQETRAALVSNVNIELYNALHYHMVNKRLLTKDLKNGLTVSSMYNDLGLRVNHYSNGVSAVNQCHCGIFCPSLQTILTTCAQSRWWPWTAPGLFTATRWPQTEWFTWSTASSALSGAQSKTSLKSMTTWQLLA